MGDIFNLMIIYFGLKLLNKKKSR